MNEHTEHLVRRIISKDIAKAINTQDEILKKDLNCNGLGFAYDLGYIADEYCVVLGDMTINPSNTE